MRAPIAKPVAASHSSVGSTDQRRDMASPQVVE